MATSLGSFGTWVTQLEALSVEELRSRLSEVKIKFRELLRIKSEVDLLKNDAMIKEFENLGHRAKRLRSIARGDPDIPPPLVDLSTSTTPINSPPNSQQDDKDENMPDVGSLEVSESLSESQNETKQAVCKFGADCDSTDPKHFFDFDHFGHPREEDMLMAYDDMKEAEEKRKRVAQLSVFDFLSAEERAEQIAALNGFGDNEDEDADESSDEEDSVSTTRSGRRRRRTEMRRREHREKRVEIKMTEAERQERLKSLLKKTENFMRTLTMRIRKNYKQQEGKSNEEIMSTADVRDFLNHGTAGDRVIEQTQSLVGGTLKDYQQVGLRWMVSLNELRLNGILADEMGLGKTVQIMSLLAYVLDEQERRGPHLVVLPLSTLSGWQEHFEKWLPSLRVVSHRGPREERRARLEQGARNLDFDVLLTTYEMCMIDEDFLRVFEWCYLVVDEAHRLKNKASKLFQTLHSLSTRHRMLLTGTPLQNNLNELWSLLHFILPDIFNSVQSFESWFCAGKKDSMDMITDEERLLVVDRLHRAIDPFLLRRVKKDVLPDLAKKEEVVIKCRMSGPQMAIYTELQNNQCLQYKGKKLKTFQNLLVELRKCANHPFNSRHDEYVIDKSICSMSGKVVLLDHLIPKMERFAHRILVFFQFKMTMDIVSEYMDWKQFKYLRIDGETKSEDRVEFLHAYNSEEPECDIFLLSTRACGLGLNLYSADTVILFDSDFNPQMDLQAQARAHRIGQTREVRVFRLMTEQSVEEEIFDRAQKKLDLEKRAIEAGRFDFSMTAEERKEFLQSVLTQRLTDDHLQEVVTDRHEINRLLARTDEEVEVFDQMDKEENFVELDTERQLPEWLEPYNPKDHKPKPLPKKRRRKRVIYTGVPSDDELIAMDQEAAQEEPKKRRSTRKRKRKVSPAAEEATRPSKRRRVAVDADENVNLPMDVDETSTGCGEVFQCRECSKEFETFQELEEHVATECGDDCEVVRDRHKNVDEDVDVDLDVDEDEDDEDEEDNDGDYDME